MQINSVNFGITLMVAYLKGLKRTDSESCINRRCLLSVSVNLIAFNTQQRKHEFAIRQSYHCFFTRWSPFSSWICTRSRQKGIDSGNFPKSSFCRSYLHEKKFRFISQILLCHYYFIQFFGRKTSTFASQL